jgi:hypothetical protein
MRKTNVNALHSLAGGAVLFLLLLATPAMADLATETCENTPDLVADDIVDLAIDTRTAGMALTWTRKGHPDMFAGNRFANKLDAISQPGSNSPRRGAATKLRQGKVEAALDNMAAYIAGVEKSKTVDDAAQATADGLVDDAIFLIGCICDLPDGCINDL